MSPPVRMAWITGEVGGVMDTRAGTRISTYDGDVEIPKGRADPDLLVYDEDVVKLRSEVRKKKARKWEKRRKAIKSLLHKIKEKLKE